MPAVAGRESQAASAAGRGSWPPCARLRAAELLSEAARTRCSSCQATPSAAPTSARYRSMQPLFSAMQVHRYTRTVSQAKS
jgi:hypothetical protein